MITCRVCLKPVIFARITSRQARPASRMPLNPDPTPAGNVAVHKDVHGRLTGRVLRKNEKPFGWERIYMPHFATCEARKQQPAPAENVTRLDDYRRTNRKTKRTAT